MAPESKDGCLFCSEKFQNEFLDRVRAVERGVQRLTYLTILTIGLLMGLGVIQVRDALAVKQFVEHMSPFLGWLF